MGDRDEHPIGFEARAAKHLDDSWWSLSSWWGQANDDTALVSKVCLDEDVEAGMEQHLVWEGQTLQLSPTICAEDILDAWYGHPRDPIRRTNITEQVREHVASTKATQ